MLKRFNFFDKELLQDLRLPNGITCSTCLSTGVLLIGDESGSVTAFSLDEEPVQTLVRFQAYEGNAAVAHLEAGKGGIFVSVSDVGDDRVEDTVVKFWDFQKDEFNVPTAKLISTTSLAEVFLRERSRSKDSKLLWSIAQWPRVSVARLFPALTHLALGMDNGLTVLLRSNNLTKSTSIDVLPPPHYSNRVVEESVEAANSGSLCSKLATVAFDRGNAALPEVTGLGFAEVEDMQQVHLWVASTQALRSFDVTLHRRSQRVNITWPLGDARVAPVGLGPILDDQGCEKNCSCVGFPSKSKRFTLSRIPRSESEREAEAASAEKVSRRQVFILGKSDRAAYFTHEDPGSCYAVGGRKRLIEWFGDYLVVVSDTSAVRSATSSSLRKDVVNLYDFQNKFVSLNFALRGEQMGNVEQIVNCCNKSLLVITSTRQVYRLVEKDTETKLGDLFKRNLYSTAISLAQASNCRYSVIMDIYRMYADHLFVKGSYDEAMSNYIKTLGHVEPSYVIRKFLDAQRVDNLTAYIEALHLHPTVRPSRDHTTLLLNCYTKQIHQDKLSEFVRNDEITKAIDVKTAINVLLKGSFYDEALELAKRRNEHDEYLKILVERLSTYDIARAYIEELDEALAEEFLSRYGQALMSSAPAETANLIRMLCCGEWDKVRKSPSDEEKTEEETDVGKGAKTEKSVVSAEAFIEVFVNHQEELLEFIKAVIQHDPNSATPLVWNTLLELNLNKRSELAEAGESTAEIDAELMEVLVSPSQQFDLNHALVLVQAHGFTAGQLHLYEKLEMFPLLIQHFMDIGDKAEVVAKCKAYGGKDSSMWVRVLTYLAQREEDCSKEIAQVLNHIERWNILPPMMVMQVLSSNGNLPLATVRSYVVGQLEKSKELIEEDEREMAQLLADTQRMREEIDQLETQPKIFTSSKCNLTGAPLELPTIHFLSGNSYNLSSLDSAQGQSQSQVGRLDKIEDPKCVAEQQAVADIIDGLRNLNREGVDEEFFHQLERSADGFETISEYFGKCLFDSTQ